MAELSRAVASLRIAGEELLPDAVSDLLGCEPTLSYAKGDLRRISSRDKTVARFGFWSLEGAQTEPADIDVQVAAILGRLTSDESAWAELGAKYDLDLFCGWFMESLNEGISIQPHTLVALGTRGITLAVDLYGPP